MKFDSVSNLAVRAGLNTAAITTNTTTNGNIIDTQGFNALSFVPQVGARTDGTFTIALTHGDEANLSDGATPDAQDVVGSLPALNAANSLGKVGYVGAKRYVRASIVSTSVSSGATVGVTAILSRPNVGPVA